MIHLGVPGILCIFAKSKEIVYGCNVWQRESDVCVRLWAWRLEAFGRCFYYGYEFSDQVDGSVRSAFIKHVKFNDDLQNNPDLTHFIKKAIDNLNRQINLYDYNLVVMPESSSKVNQYMLRYIYRFAQPMLRKMELVKSLTLTTCLRTDDRAILRHRKRKWSNLSRRCLTWFTRKTISR